MLLVAAGLEAYWSPSPHIPREIKMFVGGLLWLLVIGWLSLAGSERLERVTSGFRKSAIVAAEASASASERSRDTQTEPAA